MELFLDIDLLQDIRSLVSHQPSDDFRNAALGDAPYCDLFRLGLELRDYNFALNDHSYFQFNMTGEREFELRYAFYPNPYAALTIDRFLEQFPDADREDGGLEDYSQYLSEQANEVSAPPIRYDMAPSQYRELTHPTAHFHFGTHGDNRWPASFILSPVAFCLHIAKMFYGDAWSKQINHGTGKNVLDERLSKARAGCAELAKGHFSDAERALIHIT